MALPARIRINVSAPFPAMVQGSGPIGVTKANGIWTIGFSAVATQQNPVLGNFPTDYALVYDSSAKQLINVPLSYLTSQGVLMVSVLGINANSVADTQFSVPILSPYTRYKIEELIFENVGTTASLTAAQFGIFTAGGGSGAAIQNSGTALSGLTANTDNAAGGLITLSQYTTPALSFPNVRWTNASLFFRITNAQGAAATINFYMVIKPLR